MSIAPGTSVSNKGRQPMSNDSKEVQYLYSILQSLYNLSGISSKASTSQVFLPGVVKLTSSGTSVFSINAPLQGTTYTSVSLSVISLTSGTVSIVDSHTTTAISYPGFSTSWSGGSLTENLTITVTGDAICIITYLSI